MENNPQKAIADELAEALQGHRERSHLQAVPPTPVPWQYSPEEAQWEDDGGTSGDSSSSS